MSGPATHSAPISGGSYIRNADGSRTLVERTAERPCACRTETVAPPAEVTVPDVPVYNVDIQDPPEQE